MKNGRTIEGRIISKTESRVQIESGAVVLPLRWDLIESIEESPAYESYLIQATSALQRGSPGKGIEYLLKANESGASPEQMNQTLNHSSIGVMIAVEKARNKKKRTLRLAFQHLSEQDFLTSSSVIICAQALYTLDDWENTSSAMARLSIEDLKANEEIRKWALQFFRQQTKRRLTQNNYGEALFSIERVRQLSGEKESNHLAVALLANYAKAREQKNYKLAFNILVNDLYPIVPEITRNRIDYTLKALKMETALNGNYQEALDAITILRLIFPVEYQNARDQYIHQQCKYLFETGQCEAVMNVVDSIPGYERTEELIQIYHLAYNEVKIIEIGEDNPLELMKHGQWCQEEGLLDEAISVYNKTRVNPSLRTISDQMLTNARQQRDTQLLAKAKELYEEGDMIQSLDMLRELLNNPNLGTKLQEEADRLKVLAEKFMKRDKEARGPRAVVEYQQAERAFFRQEFLKALECLNTIFEKYPDTPAAGWAAKMLPGVLQGVEIAYIEGDIKQLPELPKNFDLSTLQRTEKLDEEVRELIELMEQDLNRF